MYKTICLIVLLTGVNSLAFAQPSKYFGTAETVEKSSIGLQVGSGIVLGDIAYQPLAQGGLYYQYHFRKWLDGRIGVNMGVYKGANTSKTGAIEPNEALNGMGLYNPTVNYLDSGSIYQNYRTTVLDICFSGKVNLIALFARQYEKPFDVYVIGGLGTLRYLAKTDALDAAGNMYPYSTITGTTPAEIKTQLLAMRDGTYESFAEYDKNTRILIDGGLGFRYRLGGHFGIGLEMLGKYTDDDLLDGQRWKNNSELSKGSDIILNVGVLAEYIF